MPSAAEECHEGVPRTVREFHIVWRVVTLHCRQLVVLVMTSLSGEKKTVVVVDI